MNKKGDFDFEWLPGFREMMACQNEEQNTQQETDWGNENLQIEALLPPEQLQQEEQRYWKDYEYFIQMLPMVAREVWIVGDALLDQYEYKGSPIYSEYPDKVTILKIADMVYDKLKYREEQEMIQADDEEMIRNPYFVEVSLRDAITPFRTLIQVILHWNINHRRQRYYRRQKVFFPDCIDEYVEADAPVRLFDAFVGSLDMKVLGFVRSVPKETGTPGYDPRDLLKLYIYGYFYQIRSSRKLARKGQEFY